MTTTDPNAATEPHTVAALERACHAYWTHHAPHLNWNNLHPQQRHLVQQAIHAALTAANNHPPTPQPPKTIMNTPES